MLNRFIKSNKQNTVFIFQVTESSLKVIKCSSGNNSKRQFLGLASELIPSDIDDTKLTERLIQVFKSLGYAHNPIIVSLARNKATCRYLKVPTHDPKEIDKIVTLQAPRYLPYPANELITGYQILSTDKEGYCDINLIIAHKDVIERYVKIFGELKTGKYSIILSSYGLTNFYNHIIPEKHEIAMVIDVDAQQAELIIICEGKVLFSRYFKADRSMAGWENLFTGEINKSRDAYLKEVSKDAPGKIFIAGSRNTCQGLSQILNIQTGLPVEILSHEKIALPNNMLEKLSNTDNSFVSLVGLGLGDTEESLNLLPLDIKEGIRRLLRRKRYLQVISYISAIILIFGLGMAKNLDNKTIYLRRLKAELNKISKDAKPLEEIERRFRLLEGRAKKTTTGMDVLYEVHRTIPEGVVLVSLNYEEGNQVVLHGYTSELKSVFEFVSLLEKSPVFKKFNIKVRYASKKRTQSGEILDFEIVCSKK
jgi:Tfp pilus assembly PilM family ATPase/Tfp pilus assembly protein PilN